MLKTRILIVMLKHILSIYFMISKPRYLSRGRSSASPNRFKNNINMGTPYHGILGLPRLEAQQHKNSDD